MTCRCGQKERSRRSHTFRRTVAGCTFTAETLVDACSHCGEPNVPAALILAFERALARELARRGPISGETFRWIRKAASLERVALARLLGVNVETIAAWEEERRSTDVAAWTVVASIALDAIEGPRPLWARIRERERRRHPTSTNMTLSIEPTTTDSFRRALELLTSRVALTDADVADALDIDCAALRARLSDLAAIGLVESANSTHDDARQWSAAADHACLVETAKGAGVDLDAPLPRAGPEVESWPHGPRPRTVPPSWRSL